MTDDHVCKCGKRFVWLQDFLNHCEECASESKEIAPSVSTNIAMDVIGALDDCIKACNDNGLRGVSEQLERVRDTVLQLRQ